MTDVPLFPACADWANADDEEAVEENYVCAEKI
jgi:hypothetical protein